MSLSPEELITQLLEYGSGHAVSVPDGFLSTYQLPDGRFTVEFSVYLLIQHPELSGMPPQVFSTAKEAAECFEFYRKKYGLGFEFEQEHG